MKVPPLSRGVIKLGKESALPTIHREILADFFVRASLPPHMLKKFWQLFISRDEMPVVK